MTPDKGALVFTGSAGHGQLTLVLELRSDGAGGGELHGELRGLPEVLELRGRSQQTRIEGVLIGLDDVVPFHASIDSDTMRLHIDATDASTLAVGELDCLLHRL